MLMVYDSMPGKTRLSFLPSPFGVNTPGMNKTVSQATGSKKFGTSAKGPPVFCSSVESQLSYLPKSISPYAGLPSLLGSISNQSGSRSPSESLSR